MVERTAGTSRDRPGSGEGWGEKGQAHPNKNMINNQFYKNHQVESFHSLKQQERFLGSPMGKGILLLSHSLIKYRSVQSGLALKIEKHFNVLFHPSWYSVMKANYNKARRL